VEATSQKQTPVTTVQGFNEDGKVTWLLEYYLRIYPSPVSGEKDRFGIKIVRNNPDGTFDHAAETFAITDDSREVMGMIKCFSKGAVRPHILDDMVDEWFSEKALCGGDASSPSSIPVWHTYHAGR